MHTHVLFLCGEFQYILWLSREQIWEIFVGQGLQLVWKIVFDRFWGMGELEIEPQVSGTSKGVTTTGISLKPQLVRKIVSVSIFHLWMQLRVQWFDVCGFYIVFSWDMFRFFMSSIFSVMGCFVINWN